MVKPIGITVGVCLMSGFARAAPIDANAGRPAAGPLPAYCQDGECFFQTVETTNPVVFRTNGVLFQIQSQNWHSGPDFKKRREADTTDYVLCSKISPAVIFPEGKKYRVTFLSPQKSDTYGHYNETSTALYFVVCHGRMFSSFGLFENGPAFGSSLGYTNAAREDQVVIDDPEKVFDLIK